MSHISIIVPVYNTATFLVGCIDSILAQSFTDFELILVDDGSTDGSSAICDEKAERDSRVKCYHQANQGQQRAVQNGLRHASGQWVLFGMELLVSAHVFWVWKKKGVCEQTDDLKYIITVYLFLELFSSNLETISLRGLSWKTVPHLYLVLPLFLLSLFYFVWYIRKYYLH